MAIAESGRYRDSIGVEIVIAEVVRAAAARTRHYSPDEQLNLDGIRVGVPVVEVPTSRR